MTGLQIEIAVYHLEDNMSSKLLTFVDDAYIIVNVKMMEINNDLEKLVKFSDKIAYIIRCFGKFKCHVTLTMCCVVLFCAHANTTVRQLCVTFDHYRIEHVNMSTH